MFAQILNSKPSPSKTHHRQHTKTHQTSHHRHHRRSSIHCSLEGAMQAPSQHWLTQNSPINSLHHSSHGFQRLLALQDTALQALHAQLKLTHPATPTAINTSYAYASIDQHGDFYCVSGDGTAGGAIRAYTTPTTDNDDAGGDVKTVRGVNASAIASTSVDFGSTRLLGWSGSGNAVPHLFFNATATGDTVSTNVAYWPRVDFEKDDAYYKEYYCTNYHGIMSFKHLEESLSKSPHFTVYEATQLGGPHTQINLQFKPTLEAIDIYVGILQSICTNWATFHRFQQTGSSTTSTNNSSGSIYTFDGNVDKSVVDSKDDYYLHHIATGPGNKISVRLFGKESTDSFIALATGGVYTEYIEEN